MWERKDDDFDHVSISSTSEEVKSRERHGNEPNNGGFPLVQLPKK